jgi:ubiquinone/menaquinone biosynthesis C-methylase UbiE
MTGGSRSPGSRHVYDRAARFYDLIEAPMDHMGGTVRRQRVLAGARGRVLEVGIGTGLNLEHYPAGVDLIGLDISGKMLTRAKHRAASLGRSIHLEQADAEALPHPDGVFDTVTATCVYCSVADPIQGLREIRRVVKANGRVLLLEHVRPRNPVLGMLFDVLTPFTRRFFGPEINRRTEENVCAAGLDLVRVRRKGIWREIEARPTQGGVQGERGA